MRGRNLRFMLSPSIAEIILEALGWDLCAKLPNGYYSSRWFSDYTERFRFWKTQPKCISIVDAHEC
jgi:hypothetical protein